jgi:hypothetical protein
MVRSPNCNQNPETTVLAHFRLLGVSGMGMKSPDVCAAWCCSNCHSYCDQETQAGKRERDVLLLKGVIRTLNELVKKDILKW